MTDKKPKRVIGNHRWTPEYAMQGLQGRINKIARSYLLERISKYSKYRYNGYSLEELENELEKLSPGSGK